MVELGSLKGHVTSPDMHWGIWRVRSTMMTVKQSNGGGWGRDAEDLRSGGQGRTFGWDRKHEKKEATT